MIKELRQLWVNWRYPRPKWKIREAAFTGSDILSPGKPVIRLNDRLIVQPVRWVIGNLGQWLLRVYVEFVVSPQFDSGEIIAILDLDANSETHDWCDLDCNAIVTMVQGTLCLVLYKDNDVYYFVHSSLSFGRAELFPGGIESMLDVIKEIQKNGEDS